MSGRLVLVATCLSSLLIWAPSAALAEPPNANSIACPSAPAGWTTPAGEAGRSVLSPNPLDATPRDLQQGTNQVTVICGYARAARTVKVTVNYALPTDDFNPYADFYVGCTTSYLPSGAPNGDHSWTAKARIYRVLSSASWSYAGFRDPNHQLGADDVAPFEFAARTLLKRAQPAAHSCTLPGKGGPVVVPKSWSFSFNADVVENGVTITSMSGGPGVGFGTTSVLTGKATDVIQMQIPDILVHISVPCTDEPACTNGSQQLVTIHVADKALKFSADLTGMTATIALSVQVVSSTWRAVRRRRHRHRSRLRRRHRRLRRSTSAARTCSNSDPGTKGYTNARVVPED